jgi:hypothetical protein
MHIVLVIVAKYGDTMCCEEERKEAILVTESMIQRGGEFVKALGKRRIRQGIRESFRTRRPIQYTKDKRGIP